MKNGGLHVHMKKSPTENGPSAHGSANWCKSRPDLGAVHAQLLSEALQRFQVRQAPLPLVVVRHVSGDLKNKQ